MNVSVDFDELSIRVLNGLDPAYSNISHALQVQDTPVTFEELFEQLLSYKAQIKILVPPLLQQMPWLLQLALSQIASRITVVDGTITGLNNRGHCLPSPRNTGHLLLHGLHGLLLHRPSLAIVVTLSVVKFMV